MTARPVMAMLPTELIAEILSWLPVKPLLRFKCVNKTWHSVISDPEFAKLQLSRSTDNHRLLLTTWPPQSVDYETFQVRKLVYAAIMEGNDTEEDPYTLLCGTCDGLICVVKELQMFIWNPTTGNCSQIPNPNASFCDRLLHGIGYNRSTGDYGVIFASCDTSDAANDTVIELYTLKTRTWKRIEAFDLDPEWITSTLGISCNGDVYWLAIKESGCTVVRFDMVEEKFKEILQLSYRVSDIWKVDFGMRENCLCVFIGLDGGSFEGLILKIEGNLVSYNQVFRYSDERFQCSHMKAICLTKNGEVVMDYAGWTLSLYDPKLGKHNQSFSLFHDTVSRSVLFQESLVSPDP